MLIDESARLHAIRDEIAASRRRSTQFGLRSDRVAPSYEPDVQAHKGLAAVAGPALDSLSDELAGTSIGLLVADQRARIVDRRVKDRGLRSMLDRARLSLGHGWDEREVGTNAIGTALESAVPVIVRGREHFADALAAVTCAAATITDVRTGQLLGAIGLVCAVQDTNPLMLPYACRIAREIEGQGVEDASLAERALLEHFVRTRRRARGAIVSVSKRNMFTNAAAARLVGSGDHALLWEWAERRILSRRERSEDFALASGERVTAQCEPVLFGSETIGALIRLVETPEIGRVRPQEHARRTPGGWASLSAGQLGVAELVASGLTNQEVATRLYVSRHTIDFHLRQVFNKLGIRSRVELARLFAEHRTAA